MGPIMVDPDIYKYSPVGDRDLYPVGTKTTEVKPIASPTFLPISDPDLPDADKDPAPD